MTLTKNIWRIKKTDYVETYKWTFGAILEYNGNIVFIDLNDKSDEEAFEKFISEEDMNNNWVLEDTLPRKFVTEDYDPDYYRYVYDKSIDDFSPKESN